MFRLMHPLWRPGGVRRTLVRICEYQKGKRLAHVRDGERPLKIGAGRASDTHEHGAMPSMFVCFSVSRAGGLVLCRESHGRRVVEEKHH